MFHDRCEQMVRGQYGILKVREEELVLRIYCQ